MGRKQLLCLALLLLLVLQANARAMDAKGQGEELAVPEITVPLGKTASDFTYSKGGALSYKGKSLSQLSK